MEVSSCARVLSLAKFAAAFTGLRTINRAGEIVRSAALNLLGADGASVLLSNGRGCYCPCYSALTPGSNGKPGALELSAGGWALCNHCPVIVPDVAHDPRTPAALYGPMLVESLVAVPIGGEESASPLGAIEVHWLERHSASADEVQMLQLLADMTALGLRAIHHRAQAEARGRLRTADLEVMSRHLLKEACERKLAAQEALTDEMTGLYNRRGLFEHGVQLLQKDRSRGCPVYVLYADIDGLKAVNDTEGHEAGDRLIQAAARALRGALRSEDLIARVGGDEFCAVLAGGHGDGTALLERLTRLASPDPASGTPAMSYGLVRDDNQPETDLSRLIQRADHVMYVLKRWRKHHACAPP